MRTLAIIFFSLTVLMAGLWWRSMEYLEGVGWNYSGSSGVAVVATRGRVGTLQSADWVGPPLLWIHQPAWPLHYYEERSYIDFAGFNWDQWDTVVAVDIPFWFLMAITGGLGVIFWRRQRRRQLRGFDVLPPKPSP